MKFIKYHRYIPNSTIKLYGLGGQAIFILDQPKLCVVDKENTCVIGLC